MTVANARRWSRTKVWLGLSAIGLIGLGVLFWVTPVDTATSKQVDPWEAVLFLTALIVVVLGCALIYAADFREPYRATLTQTLWWLPALAAVLSTALALSDFQGSNPFWKENALLLGSVTALVLWLLYPWLDRSFADARVARPQVYDELASRMDEAQSIVDAADSRGLCAERKADFNAGLATAKAQLRTVNAAFARPGARWATGEGYIAAWSSLHRAEEALLAVEPEPAALEGAHHDAMRLRGSQIDERAYLLANIKAAVKEIDPKAAAYLSDLEMPTAPITGWTPGDFPLQDAINQYIELHPAPPSGQNPTTPAVPTPMTQTSQTPTTTQTPTAAQTAPGQDTQTPAASDPAAV